MGALLDMCAGPRNIFMEEAMEMKKKYHVSDEEEMKISTVRMADVSKNLKLDLSKKEFLEDVFDNYSKKKPGFLTRLELVLILKHLVEVDTTGGFPIQNDKDAKDGMEPKRSLLLRYETIPDDHVVRARETADIVLTSEKQNAMNEKLDKKIDRKGFAFIKKVYKSMGLKKNSDISRDDFVNKFKVKYYCDALKVQ